MELQSARWSLLNVVHDYSDYIRKWVPELSSVVGKAVHDPYGRGAGDQAAKAGYPKPMVVHKDCRNRALDRYKTGLKRETA